MSDTIVPFSRRLDELEAHVRAETDLRPRLGMVLGSGLGGLADEMADSVVIPFEELPGWPAASAPGHSGRLLLGTLRGLPVVCLQGRLHMYEGLSERLVVEPALLMGRLGASILLLTNASGGVNPGFGAGTLMVIRDHINLTGRNPLSGPNDDRLGPRFPDMSAVWDAGLRARLQRAARAEERRAGRRRLRRADRSDLRDPRGGPHAAHPGRGRGRHVDGPGGHGRPLGWSARLRRLAGHQRRCRAVSHAALPRGGPGGGGEAGPRLARVIGGSRRSPQAQSD